MKIKSVVFQSVVILAFLSAVGLMFNYLSGSNLTNPFLANNVELEQEV